MLCKIFISNWQKLATTSTAISKCCSSIPHAIHYTCGGGGGGGSAGGVRVLQQRQLEQGKELIAGKCDSSPY